MSLWRELEEPKWVGIAQRFVSGRMREVGDLDQAELYAKAAYSTFLEVGHLWELTIAITTIGRVHQLRGETEEAAKWYREGLRLNREIGDRIVVLRYFEFVLEMTAARGDLAPTVRLAGAAALLRELIGYGIRFPKEQEAEQRVLEKARSMLGDEQYELNWMAGRRLKLAEMIDEAMEAATYTEQRREPAARSPASMITRREREVLSLIVAGKTDQQIADELYVSYRTVTTHVTNILNKLSANSRTEAAAIAVRQALVPRE